MAQLRTTTIFPDGTALPSPTAHSSPVPIASIVGGTVGGVVLALVAVVGWVMWGKCIERDKAKQRSKVVRTFHCYRGLIFVQHKFRSACSAGSSGKHQKKRIVNTYS